MTREESIHKTCYTIMSTLGNKIAVLEAEKQDMLAGLTEIANNDLPQSTLSHEHARDIIKGLK